MVFTREKFSIDRSHNKGEKGDTNELNKHIEYLLLPCETIYVTEANCGKSDHSPIKRSNVFCLKTILQTSSLISGNLGYGV